jgi:hypothetical protein
MVDEGTNYLESMARPGVGRAPVHSGRADESYVFADSEGEAVGIGQPSNTGRPIEIRAYEEPPPARTRHGVWGRITEALLPRSEPAESAPPSVRTKEPQAADPILGLAYDAVTERLNSQSVTLESLRTRATGILSVAALVTAFAAGIGMINTDPDKGKLLPTWAPWTLLGILFVMGWCVMRVLWPYQRWGYGPSASVILQLREAGMSEDAVRHRVTIEMLVARERNEDQLVRRALAYRGAIVLLLAETLVLVSAVAQQSAA